MTAPTVTPMPAMPPEFPPAMFNDEEQRGIPCGI